MNAPLKFPPAPAVSEAARALGKLGGRPRGSHSSPLAIWLRVEIRKRQCEGYRAREAFQILRDTEQPAGNDAFFVSDWTADDNDLDLGAKVTWGYWRKLWRTNLQPPRD